MVAYHSDARFEAEERGLVEQLAEFAPEDGPLLDALTYADMTIGPTRPARRPRGAHRRDSGALPARRPGAPSRPRLAPELRQVYCSQADQQAAYCAANATTPSQRSGRQDRRSNRRSSAASAPGPSGLAPASATTSTPASATSADGCQEASTASGPAPLVAMS